MPLNMKVTDWIDQVEVSNERLSLLDRESEKLSKREGICKVIMPNTPKEWEGDYLLKKGDKVKTLKAVKTILTTTKKAHRHIEVEGEPSGNKKTKEPTQNITDTNKCRLIRHNHLWNNCLNNPGSKNYNGTHYSKIREQEHADTTAPSKNKDKSTNSDDESKRPHKKRKRFDKEHREVNSLNSTNSNTSCDKIFVSWSQVRDSVQLGVYILQNRRGVT